MIYNYSTLYDIDFPQKIRFLRFFLRKFLLTVFHIIYGEFFDLFFLMFKVSNMNFYEKSLIYNYSTLYDINFPQKIGFLWFFLRKFLLTVFNMIYGEYYFFNVQSFKYEYLWKILDIKKYNIVETLIFHKKLDFCHFF